MRLLEMEHQPAGSEHPRPFGDDPRQRGATGLVQEHRRLHPVEMPVRIAAQILRIGLHESDVVDPHRLRPRMAIAQHRRGGVDRDHLGVGKRLRQRHRIVADGHADIEDAPRPPAGPRLRDPLDQRLPAAVRQRAEPAAGSDEDAAIVIRPRRDIAGAFLAVIAARHAVDIDGALIPRHRDAGIELQRRRAGIERGGARIEIVELPQHQRAPGLLAHLHAVALQRRPQPVIGIGVHRAPHLEPVGGRAAMRALERR